MPQSAIIRRFWVGLTLVFSLLPVTALATEPYRLPSQVLIDLADAPPLPAVSVDPTARWLLLADRPGLPSIAELAEPELRLAGVRINPRTNGPSRTSHLTGFSLRSLAEETTRQVTGLPAGARLGMPVWSPDGATAAFPLTTGDGVYLWVLDVASAAARPLLDIPLNAALGGAFEWEPDSLSLVCRVIPPDRGPAPVGPEAPAGPNVQETVGRKTPARTYQDLLRDPTDDALFAHFLLSQLVRVTLTGAVTPLGQSGWFTSAAPSPDGRWLLVDQLNRPFSYRVPMYLFPRRVEVWDRDGGHRVTLAELPLAEDLPAGFGAVRTGPRQHQWRSDAPATLCWVEARDGGDPRREAEVRDEVLTLAAPFEGVPEPLARLATRFAGVTWGDGRLALVNEIWQRTRQIQTWRVAPDHPAEAPRLLFTRSTEDRYTDPGRPATHTLPTGFRVLLTGPEGDTLYLLGRGASPEGDRPFLDLLNLSDASIRRLWQSAGQVFENPVALLSPTGPRLLTTQETPVDPPNYHLRDLSTGTSNPLTHFRHPAPQLRNVQKELVQYKRADGVDLNGTLYLPAEYTLEQGPLPLLMWAYPTEFKSADAAGQVTDSPYRFVRQGAWAPAIWTVLGYAVLDDPSMPIIGEGDREPNDTFIPQLVAGAQAAVEEMVRRGVTERDRIAIGGHSYGAFMTANLLAHSDLFRTGIARSGAYNRTLTPFGFQSEERNFWEARDVYMEMSPFTYADRIDEPILLIHGEADNNSGTFPVQTERLYAAISGLGGTARLVMLPHESHGYRARESLLHMLWEMADWLDRHVRQAPPRPLPGESANRPG